MDREKLIEILKKGIDNSGIPPQFESYGLATDLHGLVLEEQYATSYRSWYYDDHDMNDDFGNSSAKIPRQEFEKFLDEVIETGTGTRVFSSVNSFYSRARYAEGGSEEIGKQDYDGRVKISITIDNDKVKYKFLPTPPEKPQIRLRAERDYLDEE